MRLLFWGLFVAGFVACSTLGIGPVLKRVGGAWTSVPMVAGSLLGVAILVLAALFVAGIRPPMLATDTAMVCALAGLVALKVVVGALTMTGVLARG
jgi:hypothetical protein